MCATLHSILFVDDEASIRRVCLRALSQAGYRVDEAPDGRTAADKLAAARYDLLITDIKMPRMNGVELVRHARRNHHHLPVIVITADAAPLALLSEAERSLLRVLTKPFVTDSLVELAALLLKNAAGRPGTY
jgi:CheY-like chemotaxis protein